MKKDLVYWLWVLPVLLVFFPISFMVTFIFHPFWSWIEETYGIESMGHSGPADWCFWLVYSVFVMLILIFWSWLRTQMNSTSGTDT